MESRRPAGTESRMGNGVCQEDIDLFLTPLAHQGA